MQFMRRINTLRLEGVVFCYLSLIMYVASHERVLSDLFGCGRPDQAAHVRSMIWVFLDF